MPYVNPHDSKNEQIKVRLDLDSDDENANGVNYKQGIVYENPSVGERIVEFFSAIGRAIASIPEQFSKALEHVADSLSPVDHQATGKINRQRLKNLDESYRLAVYGNRNFTKEESDFARLKTNENNIYDFSLADKPDLNHPENRLILKILSADFRRKKILIDKVKANDPDFCTWAISIWPNNKEKFDRYEVEFLEALAGKKSSQKSQKCPSSDASVALNSSIGETKNLSDGNDQVAIPPSSEAYNRVSNNLIFFSDSEKKSSADSYSESSLNFLPKFERDSDVVQVSASDSVNADVKNEFKKLKNKFLKLGKSDSNELLNDDFRPSKACIDYSKKLKREYSYKKGSSLTDSQQREKDVAEKIIGLSERFERKDRADAEYRIRTKAQTEKDAEEKKNPGEKSFREFLKNYYQAKANGRELNIIDSSKYFDNTCLERAQIELTDDSQNEAAKYLLNTAIKRGKLKLVNSTENSSDVPEPPAPSDDSSQARSDNPPPPPPPRAGAKPLQVTSITLDAAPDLAPASDNSWSKEVKDYRAPMRVLLELLRSKEFTDSILYGSEMIFGDICLAYEALVIAAENNSEVDLLESKSHAWDKEKSNVAALAKRENSTDYGDFSIEEKFERARKLYDAIRVISENAKYPKFKALIDDFERLGVKAWIDEAPPVSIADERPEGKFTVRPFDNLWSIQKKDAESTFSRYVGFYKLLKGRGELGDIQKKHQFTVYKTPLCLSYANHRIEILSRKQVLTVDEEDEFSAALLLKNKSEIEKNATLNSTS